MTRVVVLPVLVQPEDMLMGGFTRQATATQKNVESLLGCA